MIVGMDGKEIAQEGVTVGIEPEDLAVMAVALEFMIGELESDIEQGLETPEDLYREAKKAFGKLAILLPHDEIEELH